MTHFYVYLCSEIHNTYTYWLCTCLGHQMTEYLRPVLLLYNYNLKENPNCSDKKQKKSEKQIGESLYKIGQTGRNVLIFLICNHFTYREFQIVLLLSKLSLTFV